MGYGVWGMGYGGTGHRAPDMGYELWGIRYWVVLVLGIGYLGIG